MDMLELSDHLEYSTVWAEESLLFESAGVYQRLAAQIPLGRVLEIGCGVGAGTFHLAQGREVMSLDNNEPLIAAARSYLDRRATNYRIHQCNLFSMSDDDRAVVQDFSPSTIVAWFLGGSGTDVYQHTMEMPDPMEKGKLYREKIEDIVISRDLLIDSVTFVDFVNRGNRLSNMSDDLVCRDTRDDYNTHVFKNVGFEVIDVKLFAWPQDGSSFIYGAAKNPNLAKGVPVPTMISILARRR